MVVHVFQCRKCHNIINILAHDDDHRFKRMNPHHSGLVLDRKSHRNCRSLGVDEKVSLEYLSSSDTISEDAFDFIVARPHKFENVTKEEFIRELEENDESAEETENHEHVVTNPEDIPDVTVEYYHDNDEVAAEEPVEEPESEEPEVQEEPVDEESVEPEELEEVTDEENNSEEN